MNIEFKLKTSEKISAFEHIFNHINPNGPGLLPGGEILPDDDIVEFEEDIHWSPGAMDVMGGKPEFTDKTDLENLIQEFMDAFHNVSENPTEETIGLLEQKLSYPDTLAVIDKVLRKLVVDSSVNQSVIYNVCRYIMLESPYRGAVKFAIGVTGLYGQKQDIEIYKILARHDEFSLYCAVAVLGETSETASVWLEMAKNVTGWGRIHIINRLCEVDRKDIRDFLVEEGYNNDILPEYSACKIAESVRLAEMLKSSSLDDAKFHGAGSILASIVNASITPGPFDGIDKYSQSEQAVINWLGQCLKKADSLTDIRNIYIISKLATPAEQGGCLEKAKFSVKSVESIIKSCTELLQADRWKELVIRSLKSGEQADQWEAIAAANTINLNIKDELFGILSENPVKPPLWYYLIRIADDQSVVNIIELAEKKLLDPVSAMMFGDTEQCLTIFIQDLERFPGRGWPLISHCLYSQNPSVRNLALKTLRTWKPALSFNSEIRTIEGILRDPDDMVRLSADNLLRYWKQ
ncbi:MAG: hypothetical protein LWY06_11790 [Firmicutes bacterium]|nr:hypothetical protein [Bacillota bacterium]